MVSILRRDDKQSVAFCGEALTLAFIFTERDNHRSGSDAALITVGLARVQLGWDLFCIAVSFINHASST